MISRRLFARLFCALAVSALAKSACGKKSDEIPVGAFFSLSGAESTFGTDSRKGIDLALEETNVAGGINGRKVSTCSSSSS